MKHLERSRVNRREFLKGLAVVPLGAALAGNLASLIGQSPLTAGAAGEGCTCVVRAVKNLTKPNNEIDIRCSWHIKGHPYFLAVEMGVTAAAKRYGFKTQIGGPTTVDTRAQVAEFETWITEKVDAIVVSAGDAEGMTPSINKAVDAGILVVTLDSDAYASRRHVFDNQANDEDQAKAQFDQLATEMGGAGEWAFIVGNFTQAQKMYQLDYMKKYSADKYPKMKLIATEECKDDATKSADIAKQLITANPNLGGIISNSGAGFPGAAQGIEELGKGGQVKVTGLTVPSAMKTFIESGTVVRGFIWDTPKLGYRAIAICDVLLHGKNITSQTKLAKADDIEEPADIRSNLQNAENLDLVLGPPLGIDKDNIQKFGFF